MMDVPPATEGWLSRNALTFAADLPDTKPELPGLTRHAVS